MSAIKVKAKDIASSAKAGFEKAKATAGEKVMSPTRQFLLFLTHESSARWRS